MYAPVKVNPRTLHPGKAGTLGRRTRKKEPMSKAPVQHFNSIGLAFPRLPVKVYAEVPIFIFIECMVNQAKKIRSFVSNQTRNTSQKQYK